MSRKFAHFYKGLAGAIPGALYLILALCADASAAAVVQRGTANRQPISRANMAARVPVQSTEQTAQNTDTAQTQDAEPEPVEQDTTPEPEPVIIENKSSQFDKLLSATNETAADSSDNELAEKIRRQRAALDAQDATAAADMAIKNATAGGRNACDAGLRACMQKKCGTNYYDCHGDTDTLWGGKIDSCRRDLPCTGQEYTLFAAEIKADRDMNAQVAGFNAIIDCGNRYNDCIVGQCGKTFENCLGKDAGDKAIAACKKIAESCTEQDGGLAARAMNVFGTLRQDAEEQIARDEARLYELREEMAAQCQHLGAMFDERTLDCVYTVNLYAGPDSTLFASKKLYAGSTFNCDANWFGIDLTTFKENAYRLTRSQTSATNAMVGAGVGTATGALTSGAIGRAIDRSKADKALKTAEKEHEENYGEKAAEKPKEKESKNTKKTPKSSSTSGKTTSSKDQTGKTGNTATPRTLSGGPKPEIKTPSVPKAKPLPSMPAPAK